MKSTLQFKRFFLFIAFSVAFLGTNLQIVAQTVNETATITWAFNLGTAGQTATYSGSASTSNYFLQDYVSLGSNLNYAGIKTANSLTTSAFQPLTQTNSIDASNLVAFNITPVNGLSFTPESIAFKTQRFGTDGGLLNVHWKSSDGTSKIIATDLKPARDNSGAFTDAVYNLTGLSIPASNGKAVLEFYIHSLGNTKQISLADIVITGNISGTIIVLPEYTITSSVFPSEAGNISSFPVGSTHYDGTEVTLTANRNFGYQFSHWADGADQQVSTNNPYTFTLNSNVELKAVYTIINTYSLDLSVNGGAADYMVNVSPAGTMVNTSRMYEEGTNVTLTASNNPILSFSNWGSGETSATLNVVMDGNKSISANYNALDYIVGWDFYVAGNAGRPADFSSDEVNDASSLILRKADGTQSSWLDKSSPSGGYEGRNAAVNWKPLVDRYYYQISFNATDYTDISIQASMLYNYNAYSKQFCEYSIDGTTFLPLGSIDLVNAKTYYDGIFNLPSDANNQPTVYIRWIPDYTSSIIGATATNDGTTISGIYAFGTRAVFNDGMAPILVTSVPANNATGASATGKVVLNFDERIKIAENTTATLDGKSLTPIVFGKSISFNYSGLSYNTTYTFNLAGNVVADLADNTRTEPISITFTTLDKPTVTKKAYDFIVGVDGNFAAALAAAQVASLSGERFFIFFPNGEYDLGNTTGDATQQTFINIPNVSFIGQSADGVILFNEPLAANEGIGTTPTINFQTNSKNIYMQDITILNKMDYRKGAFTGRAVALRDQGDRNIYKNVKLLSNQDTFYTGSNRIYLENSEIHGTVDFIFGGGDVFLNACNIFLEDRTGNHVTAAATSSSWGYVFRDCTIDGFSSTNGNYKLGRPWQSSPKTVFINTIMKVLPANEGWSEWGAAPSVYAEYNSLTASGLPIDLSGRRTNYNYTNGGGGTVVLNPVLTSGQADTYTIENVLSGTDTWQPTLFTEQASVPVISKSASTLNWDNDNYVLGWAIFKDAVFQDFVTTNSYTIPGGELTGIYTVRAANAMGGLGVSSNQVDISLGVKNNNLLGIKVYPNPVVSNEVFISIPTVSANTIATVFGLDGRQIMKVNIVSTKTTLDLTGMPSGVFFLKIDSEKGTQVSKIIKK